MNTSLGGGTFPQRRALFMLTAGLLSFSVNAATLTRDNGAAVGDNQNSQTAGPNGPTLLQDVQLIQKLQRFDRERIPSVWCMPVALALMARSRCPMTSVT